MRTIKFRAFEDGKMIYQTGALASLKRFFRVIKEDDKLMQFTEHHDGEGREVYEGDIMTWSIYEGTKHQSRWVVEGMGKTWSSTGKDYSRVIGNIYENPELLNN